MFVSLFLVILLSFSNLSKSDPQCFQYTLNNECTPILGNVSIQENEQQNFFDQELSLTVSDVRMRTPNCRRSFLSYYCQVMFGAFVCQSSSSSPSPSPPEEQQCLEEEYCIQVSEECSDDFPFLNCTTPSPPPSPSLLSTICQEEVKEQIQQAQKEPIAVTTCLNSTKETMECCIGPFIKDDNDEECVIECPQYLYGRERERGIRIFSLVLMIAILLVLFVAALPFLAVGDFSYPNYVLFVAFFAFVFANLTELWVIFEGADSYICGGEKNYLKALGQYGDSPRSFVQYFLSFFFISLSTSHWTLFSFNLFCNAARPFTSKFEKFIGKPVSLSIVLLMEGVCILYSLVPSLFLLGLLDNSTNEFFLPLPVFDSPFPTSPLGKWVYIGSLLVGGVMSLTFLVLAAALFMRRGKHIIYFQWRSLVAGGYSLCIEILAIILISIPSRENYTERVNYLKCVASHPRINPTLCEEEKNWPIFILCFNGIVCFLLLVVLLISFMTHNFVQVFWKELIFSRRVLTSYYEYERLS